MDDVGRNRSLRDGLQIGLPNRYLDQLLAAWKPDGEDDGTVRLRPNEEGEPLALLLVLAQGIGVGDVLSLASAVGNYPGLGLTDVVAGEGSERFRVVGFRDPPRPLLRRFLRYISSRSSSSV